MQVRKLPINGEGMETTKHGSFAFPLAVYHSVMSRNIQGHIPWHWHKEIQFCRVTAGEIRFFVNEKQYRLQKGDGVFVNSGYLHMAKPVEDPESAYICLDVDPELISSFPGSVFEKKYVTPFLRDPAMEDQFLSQNIPWQKEILDEIAQAYSLYEEKGFGYEFRLSALVGEMWRLLLAHRSEEAIGFHNRFRENSVAQSILIYIRRHYSRRVTLPEIAKAVSFSTGECCRIFKKVTGETIFSYLRAYRLARSMELLKDTDLSISQIAYDTGFCSTSYFIETFKAQHGHTPLQYRKEKLKQNNTAENQ